MAQSTQFDFVAAGGAIPFLITQQMQRILRTMQGKNVRLSVQEIKRRRSDKQNRYYWGCVLPIVHEMFLDAGNVMDADEVHVFLKQHIGKLTKTVSDPKGRMGKVVRSSTELTTEEWERFMEAVRAWAAEFSVSIPLPNEAEFWEGVC